MTIKGLLEKKSAIYKDMMALAHNIRSEEREFNAEERAAFDKADADYNNVVKDIERLERAAAYDADLEKKDQFIQAAPQVSTEERYQNAFNKYLRGGMSMLGHDEKALLAEKRVNVSDVNANGGYTVSTGLFNEFAKTLNYYAPILDEVRVIATASGQTMNFTTLDDTANSAAFIASQGSSLSETALSFGQTAIEVHTAASLVQMSWELINDNEFNLEGEVGTLLGERMGRLLEAKLTTGSGTNEPYGIVTDATAGVTAASATAITRDEIVDLVHSVDPAYRALGAKFMFNDNVLKLIKKLSVGSADDRPLWQPSIREGAPDTVEGFGYVINSSMADPTTGNVSMVFGDMKSYYARQAGNPVLRRLDERYADQLTSGFLLYGRYGGRLVKTDAVKKLTQA